MPLRAASSLTVSLRAPPLTEEFEGGDQGLQLSPQLFANGLSCHEGMKHKCFMPVSKGSSVSGSKRGCLCSQRSVYRRTLHFDLGTPDRARSQFK